MASVDISKLKPYKLVRLFLWCSFSQSQLWSLTCHIDCLCSVCEIWQKQAAMFETDREQWRTTQLCKIHQKPANSSKKTKSHVKPKISKKRNSIKNFNNNSNSSSKTKPSNVNNTNITNIGQGISVKVFSPLSDTIVKRQQFVSACIDTFLVKSSTNRHMVNDTFLQNANRQKIYSLFRYGFDDIWKDFATAYRKEWKKTQSIICEHCGLRDETKIQLAHDASASRKDILMFTVELLPSDKLRVNHMLRVALELHRHHPLWFLCPECHHRYDKRQPS